jgi:hypothetical protein
MHDSARQGAIDTMPQSWLNDSKIADTSDALGLRFPSSTIAFGLHLSHGLYVLLGLVQHPE